jgi:hypothetical protein
MSAVGKKKQFRSRRASEDDDEEGGAAANGRGTAKAKAAEGAPTSSAKASSMPSKKGKKDGSSKAGASMLSFGDDEEQEDEALRNAMKARKAKKSKVRIRDFRPRRLSVICDEHQPHSRSQEMRKALERMEAEADGALAAGLTAGYGVTSGEYTAEKMAELKKAQPFQLRTKASKPASSRARAASSTKAEGEATTSLTHSQSSWVGLSPHDATNRPLCFPAEPTADSAAAGQEEEGEAAAGGEEEGVGGYDEEEVKRLKEKRERSRRATMGEFVPLTDQGDDDFDDEKTKRRVLGLGNMDVSAEEIERKMGQKKHPVSQQSVCASATHNG